MAYEIDTGTNPALRRRLLGVPRAPECSWTQRAPRGVVQRMRSGLGMGTGVLAPDRACVDAVIKDVVGCSGSVSAVGAARVLERGVSVDELCGAGASVDDLHACGLRATALREMGWIIEEHETTVYDLGSRDSRALQL
jgi:hypothetical protein